MRFTRQTSFTGGELSPLLHARTDLARYANSVSQAKNFFIRKEGPLVTRPGTTFVREVKDSSATVRLRRFVYSRAQSYVLEFGNLYIRFHTGGATVESSPGVAYEVVTPFTTADLSTLSFVQSGDVLYIYSNGTYPIKKLTRLGHTSWTLTDFVIERWSTPPTLNTVNPEGSTDSTHIGKYWEWVATAIDEDGNETLPSDPIHVLPDGTKPALYADRPCNLMINRLANAKTYNVFRGRNGVFGYVGQVSDDSYDAGTPTVVTFHDDGQVPQFGEQPPTGKDPFATEYPTCGSFFEERFVSGMGDGLFFSQTGIYTNFDESPAIRATDAIEAYLAAREKETIYNLVPMKHGLVVLTSQGEWVVAGAGGDPISRTSIDAKPHSAHGSEPLRPVVIGNVILFVKAMGNSVRELIYDASSEVFTGNDLTILAEHLFIGKTITDWCYASVPWSLVHAVRNDGKMVVLTYVREHEVWGWSQYETDGSFECVETVPEGEEDYVYVVVNRTINGSTKRYVERFASRLETDERYAIRTDCTSTYNGAPATVISNLGYLEGKTVKFVADGAVGNAVVTGGQITLPAAASIVNIGLKYVCDLESLDLFIPQQDVKMAYKLVKLAAFEVDNTRGLLTGPDFDHLSISRTRDVTDGYETIPSLQGKLIDVSIQATWNYGGRVVLRVDEPVPVTVLSVIRGFEARA